MAMGVTTASVPPASIMVALPRRIISVASPMQWAPVAQAVTTVRFGPRRPNMMLTWPLAMFAISMGMKNGLTLSGPRSSNVLCWASSVYMPPMPEPTITPMRSAFSGVTSSFASSSASLEAAMAKWRKRSILRTSLFGM